MLHHTSKTTLQSVFFFFFQCLNTSEYPYTNSAIIHLIGNTFLYEH
jgi:hypothetical protein